MNKYQEALDYIKAFAEQWVVNYEQLTKGNIDNVDFIECDEHSKTLQELVDKSIPKKPKMEYLCIDHDKKEAICPHCLRQEIYNPEDEWWYHGEFHCIRCGQAIDLSEDD